MKLSKGASEQSMITIPRDPTWEQFRSKLEQVEVGTKSGSYFTRVQFKRGTRTADNIIGPVQFIVIDAEASYDPVTHEERYYKVNGELFLVTNAKGKKVPVRWCPYTLQAVSDCLTKNGIRHVGHTSYSHKEHGEDYNRFRVVVPIDGEAQSNWLGAQAYIMDILAKAGIHIVTVSEMKRIGQPWYFPRVPKERKEHFKFVHYDEGQAVTQFIEGYDSQPSYSTPLEATGETTKQAEHNERVMLEAMKEWEIEIVNQRGDKLTIVCPWADGHSEGDAKLTGAYYMLPGARNKYLGGFECYHASCGGRNIGHMAHKLGVSLMSRDLAAGFDENGPFKLLTTTPTTSPMDYSEDFCEKFPFMLYHNRGVSIAKVAENFEALANAYGIDMQYNVINRRMELDAHWMPDDTGENSKLTMITSLCKRNKLDLSRQTVMDYIDLLGDQRRYNPVTDYLTDLPVWDGEVDHIGQMVDVVFPDRENDAGFDAAIRLFLLSACASADGGKNSPNKLAKPKYEYMVVFQGKQGTNKTNMLFDLIPEPLRQYTKNGVQLDTTSKDSIAQATSCWVVELGELDSTFKKSDIARLKSFMSEDVDEFRIPYAVRPERYVRRTTFFATVNVTTFLQDATGNRRYIVVRPGLITPQAGGFDMTLAWAQAWSEYLKGAQWWPTQAEEVLFESMREGHQDTPEIVENFLSAYPDYEQDIWDGFEALSLTQITNKVATYSLSDDRQFYDRRARQELQAFLQNRQQKFVIVGTRHMKPVTHKGTHTRYKVPAIGLD